MGLFTVMLAANTVGASFTKIELATGIGTQPVGVKVYVMLWFANTINCRVKISNNCTCIVSKKHLDLEQTIQQGGFLLM